jgi:repressor LexA
MAAVVLYKRQKQILDFVRKKIEQNSCAPTLTEIAEFLDLSSLATVHEHLEALEKKNFIRRYKGAVRGIELLEEGGSGGPMKVELPILGFIAAGQPIEPYTDPEATIMVGADMLPARGKSYVLQVKGDSMIDDGILDGDYVVIKEQEMANDGDIVVAILENGFATLKRFFREKNRVRLQPANSTMSPIYATNVTIRGKVVGIVRKF